MARWPLTVKTNAVFYTQTRQRDDYWLWYSVSPLYGRACSAFYSACSTSACIWWAQLESWMRGSLCTCRHCDVRRAVWSLQTIRAQGAAGGRGVVGKGGQYEHKKPGRRQTSSGRGGVLSNYLVSILPGSLAATTRRLMGTRIQPQLDSKQKGWAGEAACLCNETETGGVSCDERDVRQRKGRICRTIKLFWHLVTSAL